MSKDEIEYEEDYIPESDEEIEYEEEEPTVIGRNDMLNYQISSGYGLTTTVADNDALNEKLKRANQASRIPEERFRDGIRKVVQIRTKYPEIRDFGTAVENNIELIPDISYKSPENCLFGLMAYRQNLINHKLTEAERKQLYDIVKMLEPEESDETKVALDIIRYGRMWASIFEKNA